MDLLLNFEFARFLIVQLGFVGVIVALVGWWRLSDDKRDAARRAVENDRWEKTRTQEILRRDEDRKEHMEKWRAMVQQQNQETERLIAIHREQMDRVLKSAERQAEALELHARLLTVIDQKIDNNQFCPMTRKAGS